jgi:hypothetical protein
MKLTPWYFIAIAPIAVAGCSGAFLGHCAVLVVTVSVFVGTLTVSDFRRAPLPLSVALRFRARMRRGMP